MTEHQIQSLILEGTFPDEECNVELMETHASWVLLTPNYAFKIKKPVRFSFLDFSTLAQRKFYCEEELRLNQRTASKLYIRVVEIREDGQIHVDRSSGELLDYAVMMNRLETDKRMDNLLKKKLVTGKDLERLADTMVAFHQAIEVVHPELDEQELIDTFNDLESIRDVIRDVKGTEYTEIIDRTLDAGDSFLHRHLERMNERVEAGFFRNCHGDLHSGNIFLYKEPIIFDCIEFNPAFRHIDLLDEVAFFVMDLDFHQYRHLTDTFLNHYFAQLPLLEKPEDEQLFTFYKLYRANVRAKISGLKAIQSEEPDRIDHYLDKAVRYLQLMPGYLAGL